jgi:hypothetical protein
MKLKTQVGVYALVVLTAAGSATAMPHAAHAEETTTKTVAWVVTTGDFANRFGSPQTLFTGEVGGCGQPLLQVDQYRYDTDAHRATVDALIAKGTLVSSSEDNTVWISNVDLEKTADCVPVTPPVTAPPTSSPTPSPTPSDTPAPTATPTAPPTSTPPSPTVTPSSPASSTTPVVGTAAYTATTVQRRIATAQAANSLAYTGSRNSWPAAIVAGLLTLTGLGFVTRAAVLHRREKMGR